ncbi:MAG TPA: geranylgeranylglycerol-phosphate geranylgeranyltransferase [Candidatus Thermoplasmatota archaeon]|nr:geranylgeranylglycerol-phosphate geranylgeranyltransferase [Candidatus Thermoplasmatota archaeon]
MPDAPKRTSYAALWKARVGLMRPGNCLMAAVGTLVGLVVARAGPLELHTWVAAPVAAFLLAGFGNVLNDLRDARLDAKAHPARPLPSGRIRVADARLWAFVLLAFGLYEAYLAAGRATFAFALANALALAGYEAWFKRAGLPGNVLVAMLVASTFAFGAVAAGTDPRDWGLLWLLVAMAFLANVARELLKDVEDQDADRGERTTLPLQAGPGPTRILAFFLVNAAVLLSVLAFFRSPDDWWLPWLGLLALADLAFVLAASLAWMHVGQAQRLLKLAMLLALLAFLGGPLVPLL